MKNEILHPKHPERICWGCDRYCPIDDPDCDNSAIRAAHLAELFGDDWLDWAERRSNKVTGRMAAAPSVCRFSRCGTDR